MDLFQDGRGFHSIVRVLGAAKHRLKTSLNCAVVDKAGYRNIVEVVSLIKYFQVIYLIKVDIRQNKEHWNLPYSSYYFNCMLRGTFSPVKVALLQEAAPNNATSWLQVQVPPEVKVSGGEERMGVCVKPMYKQYNKAVSLIEFISLYHLLGATHFIFYNHSVGAEVETVLQYYIRNFNKTKISVTVLPWSLPLESQTKIRTEAMFTSLNDCNFRMLNRVKYCAMVDLDEYLIPHLHDNLTDLLDYLNKPTVASFNFQNSFFYLYWENNTDLEKFVDADTNLPYLVTMFKTTRLTRIQRHGSRSKYVVKPENVVEVGNHNIWLYRLGKRQIKVNESLGLSHHYRVCEFGGSGCIKRESVSDTRAHHWARKLITQVDRNCRNIFDEETGCV